MPAAGCALAGRSAHALGKDPAQALPLLGPLLAAFGRLPRPDQDEHEGVPGEALALSAWGHKDEQRPLDGRHVGPSAPGSERTGDPPRPWFLPTGASPGRSPPAPPGSSRTPGHGGRMVWPVGSRHPLGQLQLLQLLRVQRRSPESWLPRAVGRRRALPDHQRRLPGPWSRPQASRGAWESLRDSPRREGEDWGGLPSPPVSTSRRHRPQPSLFLPPSPHSGGPGSCTGDSAPCGRNRRRSCCCPRW